MIDNIKINDLKPGAIFHQYGHKDLYLMLDCKFKTVAVILNMTKWATMAISPTVKVQYLGPFEALFIKTDKYTKTVAHLEKEKKKLEKELHDDE